MKEHETCIHNERGRDERETERRGDEEKGGQMMRGKKREAGRGTRLDRDKKLEESNHLGLLYHTCS